MELEVVYKAFVGDDVGLLESVHPHSDHDVDVANRVINGDVGVFNYHLMWDVFEMDLHVLKVSHWAVETVVDDFCRQVVGPFVGVGYDGVDVDIEVQ